LRLLAFIVFGRRREEVPMSFTRWTMTCLAMAGTAWLLAALGPDAGQIRAAATAPQALVDTAGPDALLLVAAGAAAWLCWGWGALGLVLTGLSALPGAGGRAAGLLLRVVLPAGARRAAAVAVGLSLAAGAPAWASTTPAGTTAVTSDWPVAQPVAQPFEPAAVPGQGMAGPPDWPSAPPDQPGPAAPAAEHVVLRGDCLWDIAADALARQRPGAPVTDAEVVAEVRAWWRVNAAVIGPDPDLLRPGQVLRAPR
jgi:hypothetical protein